MSTSRLARFDRALKVHLEANCSRNMPLLETTVSESGDVYAALPTGDEYCGRTAVLEAKRQWFQRRDWRMAANVVWTMELADTAFAVVDVVYSDADRQGLPRDKRFKQMLVFRKDGTDWKAVAEVA